MIAWPEANAFVLQRQPYRESSWLVRLLTATRGQITALWRDPTAIYLFQPYACRWQGHRALPTLRDTRFAGTVLRLQGRATIWGLYLNELCGYLAPREVSDVDLFGSYYAALRALQHSPDPEPYLRHFELRLLHALGQAPDFRHDQEGKMIQPERNYRFDGINQFFAVDQSVSGAIAGDQVTALADGRYTDPLLRPVIRRVFRQALHYQLGGRPIRARELLRPSRLEHPT